MPTKQIENHRIKAMSGIRKVTEKAKANMMIEENKEALLFFEKLKNAKIDYDRYQLEQELIGHKIRNKEKFGSICIGFTLLCVVSGFVYVIIKAFL